MSDNFTAEYSGIASIRIVTRRGGSEYHGSLFHQNKNSALAAWDIGSKLGQATFLPTPDQSRFPKPFFNVNEGGGSLGGPIPRLKRSFFLLSYERLWMATPIAFQSTSLPHPTLWNGAFSLLPDTAKPTAPAGISLTPEETATDTVRVGNSLKFIRIPQRLLNPTTSAWSINTFLTLGSTTQSILRQAEWLVTSPWSRIPPTATGVRSDWTHDEERDRISAVLHLTQQYGEADAVASPFVGLGLQRNDLKNATGSLSYIRLFGPHLVNELRGGYNRQIDLVRSNTTLRGLLNGIGFSTSDIAAYGAVVGGGLLDTFGHPAIQFGNGFAPLSNGGSGVDRPWDERLLGFAAVSSHLSR